MFEKTVALHLSSRWVLLREQLGTFCNIFFAMSASVVVLSCWWNTHIIAPHFLLYQTILFVISLLGLNFSWFIFLEVYLCIETKKIN